MPIPVTLPRQAAANGFQPRNILPDGASLVDAGLPAFKPMHRSIDGGANALKPRQVVTGIIPTYYRVDGPTPGVVVGIVLGSVVGFLFLLWLIMVIRSPGGAFNFAGENEVVVRRRDGRTPRSRHSHHSRRSSGVEVREVSRSPRRERIIVDERRGPPRRSRSIVVEERVEHRVPGDDIVEVIEGSDITPPPRRTRSRRTSDYRY